MLSLSIEQAVEIWSELEQAYFKANKYGSDTAEIYAYRLLPHSPADHVRASIPSFAKERLERATAAAESLHALLKKFSEHRESDISVDGEDFDPRRKLVPFDHRVHVTVYPRKRA